MFRKRWQVWLSLLISAVFLWLALAGLDLGNVWAQVRSARPLWLLPAFLGYFVTVWIRIYRWRVMLRPVRDVPTIRLTSIVVLGYLTNNLYPLRIGELLRAYLLRRREEVAVGAGLATIVVERVFDGLALLTMVFVGLPLAPLPATWLQNGLALAVVAFVGALFAFLVLAARPEWALRLAGTGIGLLPVPRLRAPLENFIGRFLGGIIALRSSRAVLTLFGLSLLIWLMEMVKFWLVMQAFGFEVAFGALMLMVGVVNLTTVLPSAPGYIGTFDAPGIAILVLYGINESLAGAYTLVLHTILWLPSVLFGLLIMLREGVRWSDFGRAAEMQKPDHRPVNEGGE